MGIPHHAKGQLVSTDNGSSEKEFPDTPEGWASRWTLEIEAARKEVKPYHELGDRIVKRFRDERPQRSGGPDTRWNQFSANVITLKALLYGKTPQVDVDRRFADAQDDEARVAGIILERLLNADIERDDDSFSQAAGLALDDRLLPGLGMARLRYVAQFQTEKVDAQLDDDGTEMAPGYEEESKSSEDVETDYVHWKDFLWSPARVWHEVRWVAFRAEMGRSELVKRFGSIGKLVPLAAKRNTKQGDDAKKANPWRRAEVWEIWSKDTREVFWFVEGFDKLLDRKPDVLELTGFFPCPKPMLANCTTSTLIPVPDFSIAKDLYIAIDNVSARIGTLEKAIRVVGAYDKSEPALGRILNEAADNEMVPVQNWANFSEKGGIAGAMQFMPLKEIVEALNVLTLYRQQLQDALHQITGMSDIMRGQATQSGVTATEQGIKAKYGSVRVQALQDEFARFVSDLQRLRSEVVCKHFDPQTIKERSNIERTADADKADAAIALLKSGRSYHRVCVRPENVSLTDFAERKQEAVELLDGMGRFMNSVGGLLETMPTATPFVLELFQWAVARFKGAQTIEGVFDRAIEGAKQQLANPQPQQTDPKMATEQMKGQLAMQQAKMEHEFKLQEMQAEVAANAQTEANQMTYNVQEHREKQLITAATRPPPASPVKPTLRRKGA